MIKKLLTAAAAIAMATACNTTPKYLIEGSIAGMDEGTIYLFQGDSLVDSASVAKGVFSLKGRIAEPTTAYLLDSPAGQPERVGVMLFLEPGTIRVSADAENPEQRPEVTGTRANDGLKSFQTERQALIDEYRNPETTDDRRAQLEEALDKLVEETLEANTDNIFGVALLPQMAYGLSGTEIIERIERFTPEMQQTPELIDMKQAAQKKMRTEPGNPYIDIELPGLDGQALKLSTIVSDPANRYVLLDFWASWCNPCMNEVPHLKQAYATYGDRGFEIYAVSLDRNGDAWKGAVDTFGMNWLHVSPGPGSENPAAEDYAVVSIPTNFLIDTSTGKIVDKNLRGEALGERLSELLGQ